MLPTDRRRHLRLPIIDRCLRKPTARFTAAHLMREVNAYLEECSLAPVTIRTIQKDLQYLQALPHNPAPIAYVDKGRHRYYFYEDRDYELEAPAVDSDEAFALQMAHSVLQQLSGFPLIEDLAKLRRQLEKKMVKLPSAPYPTILFDTNTKLKGIALLEPLFESIKSGTALKISYLPFSFELPMEKTIHPWWLKQSNNRWFLFGWDDENNRIDNSPLDRIERIAPLAIGYKPNTAINPSEYFAPMVGVTRFQDDKPEPVLIKVKETRAYYLLTKPLHSSQTELDPEPGYRFFQYHIIINREWISLLLSFGADIQVISPERLRNLIQEEYKTATAFYNC